METLEAEVECVCLVLADLRLTGVFPPSLKGDIGGALAARSRLGAGEKRDDGAEASEGPAKDRKAAFQEGTVWTLI